MALLRRRFTGAPKTKAASPASRAAKQGAPGTTGSGAGLRLSSSASSARPTPENQAEPKRSAVVRASANRWRKRLVQSQDKHIRHAQIVLFILGGITLLVYLGIWLAYRDAMAEIANKSVIELALSGAQDPKAILWFARNYGLICLLAASPGIAFVVCGFWASVNPLAATSTALAIFIAIEVLGVILNPGSLVSIVAWVIRGIVLLFLIEAISACLSKDRLKAQEACRLRAGRVGER
jgi:hypothetical protein